jgi:PAS domain S-box-containing protein
MSQRHEDELLKAVALQNAQSIYAARLRAEQELRDAKEQLERKTAELERSEQLLSDFFENAAVGLHWVGQDGTILRANRTELEMLGYTSEEYVGHNMAEFHVDRPVIEEILRKLTKGVSLHNCEARLRCKDGSIRHVLISSNVLFEHGKFIHSRCFTRDVTDQKQAQEVHNRLAAVVEFSDDAIISKTLDGIVTTWNNGAERIFGYVAEEMIGKPITILIPPDRINEEPAILERLRRGERIDHYETIRRRKDGTLLNISLSVSPIRDADGRIVGASKIARDVTERVRAEAALREAQEKLSRHAEELERQVNERTTALRQTVGELESFSYSISHDLRAPLRAMQSFALILSEECGSEISPQAKDYIRRITNAAERMDRLIRDVLTYSRVARGEIQLVSIPLEPLLHEIIESYPELRAKSADIQLKGPFPAVLAHEAILSQCISNLLGNAIKFVASGVTPSVRIWSELTKDGSAARLFFKDNGIGIDPGFHAKIFGIFERASTQYEGTGIGLAIVKKGMERIGGRAGVESAPGEGSTFWLELKLADQALSAKA